MPAFVHYSNLRNYQFLELYPHVISRGSNGNYELGLTTRRHSVLPVQREESRIQMVLRDPGCNVSKFLEQDCVEK